MIYKADFKNLWAAGIRALVCVLPPTARLSENSKISPNSRGKSPGRPNNRGTWGGYHWQEHTPTAGEIVEWERAKANVGLHAAEFPAIDIDVTREDIAEMVHAEAVRAFGDAPVRIGRAPKRLLMFRTTEPFPKMQLRFRLDGVEHLVELLGKGQQYVVGGIHPATNEPYTLDTDPAELLDRMPLLSREAATAWFEELAGTLELLGAEIVHSSYSADHAERLAVDQESLRAPSVQAVADLVAQIPNNQHNRDLYIRTGYAIKAACGAENEGEALDIWMEWACRWHNDAGKEASGVTQERDFLRMHAPFEIGWAYLLERAREAGVNTAVIELGDVAEAAPAGDAPTPQALVLPWSDMAMVNAVVRQHGHEIAHVTDDGWYAWNGSVWKRKGENEVTQRIANVMASASRRALDEIEKQATAEKMAMRLSSANTVAAVRGLLKTHARIQLNAEQLDADPFLLNTPNGIVDLTTATLSPHLASRHMTKMTTVGPDFTRPAPRWRQFLREATGGDVELESYLQRLVGYSLTGSAREEMLAFLYGPGGNGKSLFLTIISEMLGPYAETAAMDTFTAAHGDRHPTDMAALRGARLVTASETQASRRWDEQRVKALTGNEAVSARFMRGDYFTYRPQFTLMIAGNHAPKLENVDDAMMRRVHIVPFTRRPPVPDLHLKDTLREELPAILAWAIEGAAIWFRNGLAAPASVVAATREYLANEDVVLRWVNERAVRQEDASAPVSSAYQDFRQWARAVGEPAGNTLTEQQFGKALAGKGFAQGKDPLTGLRVVTGMTLLTEGVSEFAALD